MISFHSWNQTHDYTLIVRIWKREELKLVYNFFLNHQVWILVLPLLVSISQERFHEECDNISYLGNRYILNNNTIVNTLYIKQWFNITRNIFCQIVTNRNKEVMELICDFLTAIYKYVINRKGFLMRIIPALFSNDTFHDLDASCLFISNSLE